MTTLDDTTDVNGTRTAPTIPGGQVAAVAGPAALVATNLCFALLTLDGQATDTADYLALVADHPVLVEVGSALGLLACLLIVPAVWAVVGRLSRGRDRSRLATTGGWLMSSGYVMGTALSVEALVALSVASSSADPAGYVDAVDHQTSIAAIAVYSVFGLGTLLGGLVLGVAMLRHPDVPRWCGAALVASEPVRILGLLSGVDVLTAVASVLLLVAFVGALRR